MGNDNSKLQPAAYGGGGDSGGAKVHRRLSTDSARRYRSSNTATTVGETRLVGSNSSMSCSDGMLTPNGVFWSGGADSKGRNLNVRKLRTRSLAVRPLICVIWPPRSFSHIHLNCQLFNECGRTRARTQHRAHKGGRHLVCSGRLAAIMLQTAAVASSRSRCKNLSIHSKEFLRFRFKKRAHLSCLRAGRRRFISMN